MFRFSKALFRECFFGLLVAAFSTVGAFPLTQVDIIADYGSDTIGLDVGEVSVDLGDENLNIVYQTSPTQGHNWILSEAHLLVDTVPLLGRGAPGHYHYHSEPINTLSYTFSISLSELENRFGISFGSLVYLVAMADVYHDLNDNFRYDDQEPTEGGFGYRPPDSWIGGQPWFAYFWFRLNPLTGAEERDHTNKNSSIPISPTITKRNTRINIKSPISENGYSTLEVYNLAGTLVYQTTDNRNGTFQLDGRKFVPGIYIIKIGSFTGKLILQD